MDIDTVPFVAEENSASGIGGSGDIVNAADLLAPEANGAGEQPEVPKADVPQQNKPDDRRFTSDEMSKAVQQRLKQERRGAAYQLGREMLDEYMAANNIKSEADALAKIREDRIKQKAAAFKDDPEKGFAELMRRREQPAEEAQTAESESEVDRLYNDIVADMNAGKVPQGFDLNGFMSNKENARLFVDLYRSVGMERACELSMRVGKPVQTKAEVNGALPKSIDTNNAYQPANVDYMSMTSDEFAAAEKRIKQARAQGKRVR